MIEVQKIERFLVGQEHLSIKGARALMKMYRTQYAHEAEIIRIHPSVHFNLKLLAEDVRPFTEFKTFLGMKIEIDDKLKENEWRVGQSSEVLSYV